MTSLKAHLVLVALVTALSACTKSEVNTTPEKLAPLKQQETQENLAPAECPTADDARKSADALKNIIDQAESFASKNTVPSQSLEGTRSACTRSIQDWKSKNGTLIKSCDLLLGADGTSVHPEIPEALKTLDLGGQWAARSIDDAGSGKSKMAHNDIKNARTAIDIADKLVAGTLQPSSVILSKLGKHIGKYIEVDRRPLRR